MGEPVCNIRLGLLAPLGPLGARSRDLIIQQRHIEFRGVPNDTHTHLNCAYRENTDGRYPINHAQTEVVV